MKILALEESGSFNSLEKQEISILPANNEKTLGFEDFMKMKTLASWSSIVRSKELIHILNQGSFINYYQPIVSLSNGETYGYEALLRGIKKDGSIMPPYEMFKLAKEADMMFNLDRQARQAAIRNSAKLNIDKKIFINFIPTSIYNPENCLNTTFETLSSTNLKPEQIVFEVVETEKVEDYPHLKKILDFYRRKGFSIALDDVGSGYNSVDTFSELYPEYIKVDIDIVRNIHKDTDKQRKFERIVELTKKNKVKILAEGVEFKEDLDYVTKNGADLAQGYYFGKPSPTI